MYLYPAIRRRQKAIEKTLHILLRSGWAQSRFFSISRAAKNVKTERAKTKKRERSPSHEQKRQLNAKSRAGRYFPGAAK
ncbi:MAG: hypothetical protein HFI46_06375 [Lachnospiraceae bacterium]|nr:hypothetical protein [Lachnospiraceae bacterium]